MPHDTSGTPASKLDKYIAAFRDAILMAEPVENAAFRDALLMTEPVEDELRRLCRRAYRDGVFDALRAVPELTDAERLDLYTKLTHGDDVGQEK